MVSVQEADYWQQRYREGTDRWDIGQAAPPFAKLLNSSPAPKPGRTAVLGCGRGYDALLFAAHGFEVMGFDFAPAAIAAATVLAQTSQNPAQFLQRNIFDLATEFPGSFDYVLEHTCFCAIAPEQRPDYVQLVHTLLKAQGQLLALFFTHNRPDGPPFGITPVQIQQYFRPSFQILELAPVANSIPERQGEEHLGRFQRQD
ncbi:methyltransferase domain-containing protein [Trichocoleus sp. FACHB-591]|uniref:methyltransferase domain-containing protein n=1 Tax=Trichocoleus sp. FACHB-591 TaxID=2692872 RepID=UPI001688AF6A|nr:methyltransferase domain-containing protein [Trichocoleus sp. FACHB-591]MBD2094021.1 methyltransferase domain-containing protein [Trichocoleus sp. FACHB-591]